MPTGAPGRRPAARAGIPSGRVPRPWLLLVLAAVALTAPSSAALRVTGLASPDRPPPFHQAHSDHVHDAEALPRLALAVDGAVTPEAISDDRAYAHFLGAMASQPDPHAVAAALHKLGLSAADRASVHHALAVLGPELAALADPSAAGRPSAQDDRRRAFERARASVEAALSPAGAAQLDTYVQTEVKRRIRIYRAPMALPAQEPRP